MATHASRNTTTGLRWEDYTQTKTEGINISQNAFYRYLSDCGVDWKNIMSRQIRPDEAYITNDNKLIIYEKKYQQTEGSADEKPQTCGFKISQFRKAAAAIGIAPEDVSYIYIFNDWFKNPKYKDMLDYINSVPGCSYMFKE